MDCLKITCLIVLVFTIMMTSEVTSQGESKSLNGGADEHHPPANPILQPEGRQEANLDSTEIPFTTTTRPPMQTISFDNTVKNTVESPEPKPDPLGSENGQRTDQTPQAFVSLVFIAAVIALCVVGCVAFVAGIYCWHKHADIISPARRVLYRSSDSSVLIHNDYQPMGDRHETMNGNAPTSNNMSRLAEKTDYPAYGVTGPNPLHYSTNRPPIDVNLNRSAEVYHYQQQKQRIKSMNSSSSNGSSHSRPSTNDTLNEAVSPRGEIHEEDEENSDGEYTVYECPGLALTTDGPMEIHNPLFADSDSGFSSFSATNTLGGGIVQSTYDYSTKVGGQG